MYIRAKTRKKQQTVSVYKSLYSVFRPIINSKFEEKTCGDGPSLTTMFEDDKHLQNLISEIRVGFDVANFLRIC